MHCILNEVKTQNTTHRATLHEAAIVHPMTSAGSSGHRLTILGSRVMRSTEMSSCWPKFCAAAATAAAVMGWCRCVLNALESEQLTILVLRFHHPIRNQRQFVSRFQSKMHDRKFRTLQHAHRPLLATKRYPLVVRASASIYRVGVSLCQRRTADETKQPSLPERTAFCAAASTRGPSWPW